MVLIVKIVTNRNIDSNYFSLHITICRHKHHVQSSCSGSSRKNDWLIFPGSLVIHMQFIVITILHHVGTGSGSRDACIFHFFCFGVISKPVTVFTDIRRYTSNTSFASLTNSLILGLYIILIPETVSTNLPFHSISTSSTIFTIRNGIRSVIRKSYGKTTSSWSQTCNPFAFIYFCL